MRIEISAIKSGDTINEKYTCDGENINPPLLFSEVPQGAKSLALIVDDPDSPVGVWNHWTVWNIHPETTEISENKLPEEALQGETTFGESKYGGPCPHKGRHRYFFKLYALDKKLELKNGATKEELIESTSGHIIAEAEIMGTYERKK